MANLSVAIADLALPRIPRPTLAVEPLDGPFDSRFDALWDTVRGSYPAICRRDSAVLQWRYRHHPDGDYQVLILGSAEALRGYCVFKVFDRGRRRWGKIVDLLTAPGDDSAGQSLIAGALHALRRARVERVECFYCGAEQGRTLAGLGFTRRLTKTQRPQPLMARNLRERTADLYVTQGDGDGG